MENQFKKNHGKRYLLALFYETTLADKSTVVYSLKDEDYLGYPSLFRLYMECADPTEYRFAMEHLDGYQHWEELCVCKWFKPHLTRWRKELALKLQSEALTEIVKIAKKTTDKNSYQANKFLLEKGWAKDSKGRPSKEDVKARVEEMAENETKIISDFERLVPSNVTSN